MSITLDQFFRPQPGGIATYVRGLVGGLAALHDDALELRGVAPRGTPRQAVDELALQLVTTAPLAVVNRLWARWPLGVPGDSDVVHATSLAGPFGGGRSRAVHSVTFYDLLWRDEPSSSTAHGVAFHERRLQLVKRRRDVRVLCASPTLAPRLIDDGFDADRLYDVRLGVDDVTAAASRDDVRSALASHGVVGPFTLYAGTREPRKNLQRLIRAHEAARATDAELGALVLVGPAGWGELNTESAIVLGAVSRTLLQGLYRDAALVAYVPTAEGWGLPPVEALHAGTRVVASATTPSVATNEEATLVDPLEVEAIATGLLRALRQDDDETARARRRASVAHLTWRNVALDHLAAWQ